MLHTLGASLLDILANAAGSGKGAVIFWQMVEAVAALLVVWALARNLGADESKHRTRRPHVL